MKVATLEIDVVMAGLSRLTGDLAAIKRSVGQTMGESVASYNAATRAAETFIGKLENQAATAGKTAAQIRAMDVAARALAASNAGRDDLAERLRAAGAAADAAEAEVARLAAAEAKQAAEARAAAEAEAVLARAMASAARERDAAIASATSYAERLEAEVAAIGKTSAQLKQMEIAQRAAAAEAANMPDLAARIREAGAAMQKATVDASTLAGAEARLTAEHAALAAQVRGSYEAQMADVAAAERLRASTDPLYAATKRLNDELAESTRLYHAGVTPPAEYARQQDVLTARLRQTTAAHNEETTALGKNAWALKMTAMQIPDIVSGLATGQKPMQVFFQQGGQIVQIAQMAEGGIKGWATQVGALAMRFTPLIAAAGVAYVAFDRWHKQLNDDSGIKKYVEGLDLTHKELKKLEDQSVTVTDVLAGVWKTINDGTNISGGSKSLMDQLFGKNDIAQVEGFVAQIYGVFVGGYNAIVELWGGMATTVRGYLAATGAAAASFFKPVVDAAKWAWDGVSQIFNSLYNLVAGWAKSLSGWIAPVLKAVGLDGAASAVSSSGSHIGQTFGSAYSKAVQQAMNAMNGFVAQSGANAVAHAQDRLKKQADEIKADRTPKSDKHAEQLAREAEAIEAQIVNLYKLADAYGVSGAAALIAEAREKAESKAIKERGDIEAAVDRQIRLTIAQRIADAAKATASLTEQARVQNAVNAQVEAGLIPAARAAQAVQDQTALLPLLAAQQAAQQKASEAAAAGDTQRQASFQAAADKATTALTAQRAAQDGLTASKVAANMIQDRVSTGNEVAILQEQLRLIGATDAARVHEIATIKASQDAQAAGLQQGTKDYDDFIARHVRVADLTQQLQVANDNYNTSLSYQAQLFTEIDQRAQAAAQGMADAFGKVGEALGGLTTSVTGYFATQAKLLEDHRQAILKAGDNEQAIQRENMLFAQRSAAAQDEAFGTILASAQKFFKAGSTGYKVMEGAEKAYRAVQLALAIETAARQIGLFGATAATKVATDGAMAASDTTRAGIEQANSVATAAKKGVEAVVNAIASLPFPLNLAAGAATLAAVVALGIGISGGFGGKNTLAKANDGTGTVLGDSSAQSDSIQRSIDALKDVDQMTMTYSSQMLVALKSIDSKIGGVASLIARAGNVNASQGVTEGLHVGTMDVLGSTALGAGGGALAGAIVGGPIGAVIGAVLGGVLGKALSSLFGTKTTVIGSGLYGAPQSLGDIVNGGYDAQYYSDIEKKKKFFGITTSTKYSTQYAAADPTLENQFTLILRQFYQAVGAAAAPLGVATSDVEQRLNSFVVDIGKIDLQGLSGDEVQKKLEAVFGAAADNIAQAAIPGLEQFQQVGEGYFETLVRVASTVEQVTVDLNMLGQSTEGLSVAAKMSLSAQFDSLDAMNTAIGTYFADFYSDAEQAAVKSGQMAAALKSLGLTMPDTLAGYRQLVEAQDLTTDAGQATYASLIKLAPAFAELMAATGNATSQADIMRERLDLQKQIMQLEGDTAGLRAQELSQVDASNRSLQERIYALQDEQTAAQAAADAAAALAQKEAAVAQERAGLMNQLWQQQGDTASIRAAQLAALDESNRALQQQIWALQDQAAATQAAAQAAADAAAKEQQIAQERAGLQTQLNQLLGDTAALRADELAKLDPSNRALQQRIYDLQDEQAAQTAAAAAQQAATEAAQKAAEAADQLRQAWASIGDTILAEVQRIRGLTGTGSASFASLLGQFNAATNAARAGDQTAAGKLADLSKSVLDAAAAQATSQQELNRIQNMIAGSLQGTYDMIQAVTAASAAATAPMLASNDSSLTSQAWWSTYAANTAASAPQSLSATDLTTVQALLSGLRDDVRAAGAAQVGQQVKTNRLLDQVTQGGTAMQTTPADAEAA